MTFAEDEYRRNLKDEAEGALAESFDKYEADIARWRAVVGLLAQANPVMEVEGTTICALCDTSEHYRLWPRHKDHCPWQQAKDMTEE